MTVWVEAIRCQCCKLVLNVRRTTDRPAPTLCRECGEHRGVDPVTNVRRLESHLAMKDERLTQLGELADKVIAERDAYRRKMGAAYASREVSLGYLRRLTRLHEPMGQGRCLCRAKDCESLRILDQRWVRDQIRKLEEIERQREAELRAIDRSDDWSVMQWDALQPPEARSAG